MTNTINNVPRELLEDLLGNDHDKRIMAERHLLAMLAAAPVQQVSVPDAAFRNVDQALDLIVGIRHGKNVTQNELWQACELLDAALAAHRAAPAPGGE